MKLLEEDEDESMHSGADVEAFTAALNRDIGGDTIVSQPSDADTVVSTHESHLASDHLMVQYETSSQEESLACHDQKLVSSEGSNPMSIELMGQFQNSHCEGSLTCQDQKLVSSQGNDPMSNQLVGQCQSSCEESLSCQDQKQVSSQGSTAITNQSQEQEQQHHYQSQEQDSYEKEHMTNGTAAENQNQEDGHRPEKEKLPLQHDHSNDQQHQQQEQSKIQPSEKNQVQISGKGPVQPPEPDKIHHSESHYQQPKLPQLNNQPAPGAEQANSPGKKIAFHAMLPFLRPHLDKDRAMQLETIFNKLRKNEVDKEGFLRVVRNIVGDQMLRLAAHKIQIQQWTQSQAARNPPTGGHQYQLQSQVSPRQHHRPSSSAPLFTESQHHLPSSQHLKGPSAPHPPQVLASVAPAQTVSNSESRGQISKETEHRSDSQVASVNQIPPANMITVKREMEPSAVSVQTVNKQQPPVHLPPTSFPMYGGAVGNYSIKTYSGPSIGIPATSTKADSQDPQVRPDPPHFQSMVPTQLGTSQLNNPMNSPRYELRSRVSENKRVQGGSLSNFPNLSPSPQNQIAQQLSLNKDQKNDGPTSMAYQKQELVDQMAKRQQKPQFSHPPSSSSFGALHIDQGKPSLGSSVEGANEKQSARMAFPTSTVTANQIAVPVSTQPDSTMQMRSQMSSAMTPFGPGTNARTPPKKPSIGQKKPLDSVGTPSAFSSKKQKVSGAPPDQSIEHLNDVTAVSGVNLREEEEQLLSAPKEDSRATEATRRVVQEEEERLILQRGPLQKKLAEIISKCGIKSTSNDVGRCLSMCVEERMRGLISSLIRQSKQRIDIEKPRHRVVITSDVRRQILMMNRKAKEEWEKKQAEEAEKLRKHNESEGNAGTDADKEKDKDEGRSKATKANKEEDDKMRATAANVAARAAVGGDDVLSKWQLMAEQARQKREGGQDVASYPQPTRDQIRRSLSTSGNITKDNQEVDNRGPSAAASGAIRKLGRNQLVMPQSKFARTISVKDVISVLEREPQMSRSTLIYRLYERGAGDAMTE